MIFAAPVAAQDVPSGQPIELSEVLIDAVGSESWLRFRFVAPRIGAVDGAVTYQDAIADFQALCDGFALPYMADFDLSADVVVISLMDRAVPFGQADPNVTQFFEAFRPGTDMCVWEAF